MNDAGKPTIDDIARLAGVSKGTVNRAIHDKPGINSATKERILAIIEEQGFSPNYHARSLATGRTETIGVLLPDVENEFFAMICSEIEKMCWEKRYVMNLAFSNDVPDRERAVLQSFVDRDVDGLIVFPVSKNSDAIERAIAADKPVVLLLNDLPLQEASAVLVNERGGIETVVQHLVDAGHRRIAYINGFVHYSGSYNDFINQERLRSFRETLQRNRVPFDADTILEFKPELYAQNDPSFLTSLFASREAPTAIVCFHDRIAIWLVQALKDMGLRVPEDVSVTGFDDIRELRYITPRLTTYRVPIRDVASEALRILFQQLEHPSAVRQRVVLHGMLVPGASTLSAAPAGLARE